jgi:hypothetical protein
LNLFNTLPNEVRTGEARDDVVVKSEVFDPVLRYSVLCLFRLVFDCELMALQDSFSDRKNIVVKSEMVETKLSHGALIQTIKFSTGLIF